MRLIEAVTKRIQQAEVPDQRGDRCKVDEADVAKAEMDFPENSRVTYDDESPDNPTMDDEKYVFKATLDLPKSLKQCRQDVDSHNINITHRFKLMVNIHNPEGHVSQVICNRSSYTRITFDLTLIAACLSPSCEIVHLAKFACRRYKHGSSRAEPLVRRRA